MKPANGFLAFVLLAAASFQVLAQAVTEADATALLAKIDRAVPLKDIGAIGDALSDDVVIDIRILVGGQPQSFTFSKAEYLQGLADSWAQGTDYKYERRNQTIAVSDTKATVTADVLESMVIEGQDFSSTTREVTTIERVNGDPLITRIVGESSVQAGP